MSKFVQVKLKDRLRYVVPFHLEEFSFHKKVALFGTHVFPECIDSNTWYQDFIQRVFSAADTKQFLPVFRMSHGEFHFALGTRLNPETRGLRRLNTYCRILKEKLGIGAYLNEFSPQAATREVLNKSDYLQIKDRVINDLRWIAENGLICASFHRTPGYVEYMPEIFDWMDAHCIPLNSANYFHFYFVYALLFGSAQEVLFAGRNILVVTSFPGDKRERVSRGLLGLGARDVETIEVSSSRALFDKISTESLENEPDLVLVGAGVGSTNIIRQLGHLNCPVMDVGFGIDALADKAVCWGRPFCITDNKWDSDRIKFQPQYDFSTYRVDRPFTINW